MGYKKVMQSYYQDVDNLSSLLREYVDIYKNLILATGNLNDTSVMKKSEIKHCIDRVEDLGDIIDDLIKGVEKTESAYVKYCLTKSSIIQASIHEKEVLDEIHKDICSELTDNREITDNPQIE